ncbi:MAG TPA: SOS response-associated peptidase [Candidatus Kapabacteria bacterium]|jgi:putative SOS response-associated peptidase YedK|nr:SOS response-associated peptidase [Candidatus Kapabacteria bacterium]
MCGRYTLATDVEEFLRLLELQVPEELRHPRRYNIAPSQPVLGIVADPHPRLEIFEWGYLPSWAKPEREMKPVINARGETIAEKPYFKGAYRSSRCALLADGFYEWQKVGREKHPYRITLKEGGVFGMAGLWSNVNDGHGSQHVTCAIITVGANAVMKPIHDRMPLILDIPSLELWLDPRATARELDALLAPPPAEMIRAYEVSTAVNSPSVDRPECIEGLTGGEA